MVYSCCNLLFWERTTIVLLYTNGHFHLLENCSSKTIRDYTILYLSIMFNYTRRKKGRPP